MPDFQNHIIYDEPYRTSVLKMREDGKLLEVVHHREQQLRANRVKQLKLQQPKNQPRKNQQLKDQIQQHKNQQHRHKQQKRHRKVVYQR